MYLCQVVLGIYGNINIKIRHDGKTATFYIIFTLTIQSRDLGSFMIVFHIIAAVVFFARFSSLLFSGCPFLFLILFGCPLLLFFSLVACFYSLLSSGCPILLLIVLLLPTLFLIFLLLPAFIPYCSFVARFYSLLFSVCPHLFLIVLWLPAFIPYCSFVSRFYSYLLYLFIVPFFLLNVIVCFTGKKKLEV